MNEKIIPAPAANSRPHRVNELLGHLPLFRDLSAEEIERVANGTSEVKIARGQILFNQGDPCVGFHAIVYGQIKLAFAAPNGAEKVVEIIGPGGSFGEALMFMDRPYVVYSEALADSLLLHISKHVLFACLDQDPTLARRMLAGLSRRLHALMSDLEAYTLRSASQRVIGYLLRLEEDQAVQRVTLPAQKTVIASRLSLTPEYFSHILHDLITSGLICVDGRDIEIVDVEGLRAYGSTER